MKLLDPFSMSNYFSQLLDAGRYKEAYDIIKPLHIKNPNNNDILCLKGYLEFKTNKIKESKESLLSVISRVPKHPEAHKFLGEIYIEETRYAKAFNNYKISYEALNADYTKRKLFELAYFMDKVEDARTYLYNESLGYLIKRLEMEQVNYNNEKLTLKDSTSTDDVNKASEDIQANKTQTIYNPEVLCMPSNRAECMDAVYSLIRKGNILVAFNLLKKCFDESTKKDLIENIIALEMSELLTVLLEELHRQKLYATAYKIANVILHIFCAYARSHFGCLAYLLQEGKYDQIQNIGCKYISGHNIYTKTTEILDEMLLINPDLSLCADKLVIEELPKDLKFMKYFAIDGDYVKSYKTHFCQ